MLSINPIKSVAHAQEYYMGTANYYLEGGNKSLWWGKGAAFLGLSGTVQKADFEQLLEGKLPSGQLLGKIENGKRIHRPGFDLTFSLPKSLSILALRGEDKAIRESIIQASYKAVQKTLNIIEENCACARITKNGDTSFLNTGNLVTTLHLHELSRMDEADIHIHAVIMNMTERPDKKWRALGSKEGYFGKGAHHEINGFFERVGHQKKQFGTIFRSILAHDLKQQGFPIVVTNRKHGFFDVAGISKTLMEVHSTRTIQKNNYMEEHGLSGGNAAALAVKITRPPKTKRENDVITQEWIEKESAKNVDARLETQAVIRKIKDKQQEIASEVNSSKKQDSPSVNALEAVQHVIDVLSETNIKMRPVEIINKAIADSNLSVEEVIKALHEKRSEGELILIEKSRGEMFYTTKGMLEIEKSILDTLPSLADKQFSPKKIHSFLSKKSLSQEQKQAISTIFLSNKRITALEGPSKTGKTSLIKPMAEIARANGMASIILTTNKSGAIDIKSDIQQSKNKIKQFVNALFDRNRYYSVSSFIFSANKQAEIGSPIYKNAMIFVDHAQLLSLKTMHDLITIAEKNQARLVPVFDKRSLLSWQSGNPILQMLEQGMETAHLKDVKSKASSYLQHAVKDTLKNNIEAVFGKLDNKIVEIQDKNNRLYAMASTYTKLDSIEREKSHILMQSRAQCDEMNFFVRGQLKKEQQLDSIDVMQAALIPKNLKKDEYRLAKNYQVGQWLRFNETYATLKVRKGDYRRITHIHKPTNQITLEDHHGQSTQWNPQKVASANIEVFYERERSISVGETLIWRRNQATKKLASGEKLKVVSMKTNKLILERENNKKVSIDLRDHQNKHFDYAYALTPHQVMDRKIDTLIAYQNAHSRQSHQRAFYKLLSSAKQDIWIFTESKSELLNNIQKYTGDKNTVIDTLLKDEKKILSTESLDKGKIKVLEQMIVSKLHELKKDHLTENKTPEVIAKDALNYAIAHLSEREAVFQLSDIVDKALKSTLGDASYDAITYEVLKAKEDGKLMSVSAGRVTTQEAIEIEHEIIHLAKCDRGKLNPIIGKAQVTEYLSANPMKKDHAKALYEWMSTKDRTVIIQGDAGTGKTTLLQHVNALKHTVAMLPAGHRLLTLAPTHSVVDELKSRGLCAQTLDSFISEKKLAQSLGQTKKYGNQLIIAVDENSMVSNRKERDFLSIVHAIEARAALIGDSRQFSAIESGKPHTLLQSKAFGIKTIYLTDIVRQKNNGLSKAVAATYQRDFKSVFNILSKNIIEIGREGGSALDNKELRLKKIGGDYLSLAPLERARTGIITISNEDRTSLNKIIRAGLKESEELYGNAVNTNILVSKDMTKAEQTRAVNFEEGDIIRFGMSDASLQIKKGDYLIVKAIHDQENIVTLTKQTGEDIIWQPKHLDKDRYSGIEVFKHERRQLMSGDLIRWRRTDKDLGLINPELVRVLTVDQKEVSLQRMKSTSDGITQQGKPFNIPLADPKYQHWDYAHAITSFASQSKGFNKVMINMQSYSVQGSSQVAFLIGLTRAINEYTLYTDNKDALLRQITRTPGSKTSALEAIQTNINRGNTDRFNIDDLDKALLSPPSSGKDIRGINSSIDATKTLNKVREIEHEI